MNTKTVKSSHLRVVLKMALGRGIPSVVIYDVRNRGHSLLLRSFSAVLRRQMSTGILLIEYITKSVAPPCQQKRNYSEENSSFQFMISLLLRRQKSVQLAHHKTTQQTEPLEFQQVIRITVFVSLLDWLGTQI